MAQTPDKRRVAAATAFKDVLGRLRNQEVAQSQTPGTLDGKVLAELLAKNFEVLDPDNNGITREEIARALLMPERFSEDEFVMLQLLGKYFDTIINMSDDEPGAETVITSMDMEVMNQFLLHADMGLEDLHDWMSLGAEEQKS